MRAAFALIAVLALCVTPVVAQGKTKAPATLQGVGILEMCEHFAAGDVLALESAIGKGWDAYEDAAESPFVASYSGSKDVPGLGYATMFALVESYPSSTFGYCRVDLTEVTSPAGIEVEAIAALDRYAGETVNNDEGTFVSLSGATDPGRLLLAQATPGGFVIQLSIITPKAASAAQ